MAKTKTGGFPYQILLILFAGILFFFINKQTEKKMVIEADRVMPTEYVMQPRKDYEITIKALDEGNLVFNSSGDYYRYGPSIMTYEDGSMDAWFSAPGNSSSEWDWITYRHSDDGINWSKEQVVLKPTRGSKDNCSVCDPGVFYYNGYYYLGYTSTDYASGKGTCNSAFVARSKKPAGPFEKWNGSGWGGNPEPIIAYENDPRGWGIGELSFVIKDDELFVYYTYFDLNGGYTGLMKADLVKNWPLTMRDMGMVCPRVNNDSLDVVYAQDLDLFLAFSIDDRMSESSQVIVYKSPDGRDTFEKMDTTKKYIDDYAHNLGISKDAYGHIDTSRPVLIGYAFGKRWGHWSTRFQYMNIVAS